jgi:hypothetical protein
MEKRCIERLTERTAQWVMVGGEKLRPELGFSRSSKRLVVLSLNRLAV